MDVLFALRFFSFSFDGSFLVFIGFGFRALAEREHNHEDEESEHGHEHTGVIRNCRPHKSWHFIKMYLPHRCLYMRKIALYLG